MNNQQVAEATIKHPLSTRLLTITVELHNMARVGEDLTKVVVHREAVDQSESWFTTFENVPLDILDRLFDLWLNGCPRVQYVQVLKDHVDELWPRRVVLAGGTVQAFALRGNTRYKEYIRSLQERGRK